jgi:hypothetical protein
MAYPIYKGFTHDGIPTADGDLASTFLKLYPRATKGKKSKSLKARANRRKAGRR